MWGMQEFNTAAERLGLLNAAGGPGKRARGVAYEARVDRDAGVAANFVSADLKVTPVALCIQSCASAGASSVT